MADYYQISIDGVSVELTEETDGSFTVKTKIAPREYLQKDKLQKTLALVALRITNTIFQE